VYPHGTTAANQRLAPNDMALEIRYSDAHDLQDGRRCRNRSAAAD